MVKDSLNQIIGNKLKKLRHSKNLSLDKVAKLTNVSKPMLAQIEKGETNPTVATLWKIASGLGVPFSFFLEENRPKVTLIDRKKVESLAEESGKYHVTPLFRMQEGTPFECFSLTLDSGCDYQSEAHPQGVEEYIFVEKGELTLQLGEDIYTLSAGQAIRFSAENTHYYRNKQQDQCQLILLNHYR